MNNELICWAKWVRCLSAVSLMQACRPTSQTQVGINKNKSKFKFMALFYISMFTLMDCFLVSYLLSDRKSMAGANKNPLRRAATSCATQPSTSQGLNHTSDVSVQNVPVGRGRLATSHSTLDFLESWAVHLPRHSCVPSLLPRCLCDSVQGAVAVEFCLCFKLSGCCMCTLRCTRAMFESLLKTAQPKTSVYTGIPWVLGIMNFDIGNKLADGQKFLHIYS